MKSESIDPDTIKDQILRVTRKELVGHPLLQNYPGDIDKINWMYIDKELYVEMENILLDNGSIKLFDPFIVDNFYPEDMFLELVDIVTNNKLEEIDFSNQMNKWEQGVEIPKKFIEYAVDKVRKLLEKEDIHYGYHMYAHHQITSEKRIPKLPLHVDWAPGPYMVDLHIGGNRDWGFVARYENFVTKPNQAIICQPQFDYHYRPSWNNDDPNEYYQALFFHLINKNHWSVRNEAVKFHERDPELMKKNEFGKYFRDQEIFTKFQRQRRYLFDEFYIYSMYKKDLPEPPWNEVPDDNDKDIHQKKGVTALVERDK
jgi:hypothetical protein